jgi:alpha-ketoglutarate-dependent taurine dioxygenase
MIKNIINTYRNQGYVLLNNQNKEEFKKFVNSFGYTMKTIYSDSVDDFWMINGKCSEISNDLAYSNCYLEPHTDCAYMTEPPNVIAFNCVNNSEVGGSTILVDSKDILSNIDCVNRDVLSNKFYTWYNNSTKYNLSYDAPILDRSRNIFRFNVYDLDQKHKDDCIINGIKHLILNSKYSEIKLEKNQTLFIDNYRMLHGRLGFIGDRCLYGSYIDANITNSLLKKYI